MNEDIHCQTYFQTPVYVAELPELINPINKVSDPYIEASKKRNKEVIKKRDKFYRKKLGDFSITHHSTTLINAAGFEDLKHYVERRSFEIMDHIGYDMNNYQ